MIEYIVKRSAIFVCERCGDIIEMKIPSEGNKVDKSYCCKARYQITNDGHNIFIDRLADDSNEPKEVAIPLD